MRVPDLDWRNDLFDDAIAVDDSPIVSRATQNGADGPLWPALQRMWHHPLSVAQLSAARNAINVQRS